MSNLMMSLSAFVLFVAICYFSVFTYKYLKDLASELSVERDLLKAEIRNQLRLNIQSLDFSKEYHDELNALLERLEG